VEDLTRIVTKSPDAAKRLEAIMLSLLTVKPTDSHDNWLTPAYSLRRSVGVAYVAERLRPRQLTCRGRSHASCLISQVIQLSAFQRRGRATLAAAVRPEAAMAEAVVKTAGSAGRRTVMTTAAESALTASTRATITGIQ
jgi:hypothetical protein